MAPNLMLRGYGMITFIVNTKRWDLGNARRLTFGPRGQGKPLAGHCTWLYMPLLRETIPAKKEDNGNGANSLLGSSQD